MSGRMTAARGMRSRRIATAASVVFAALTILWIPPAVAQVGGPRWAPHNTVIVESGREVVLTLSVSWDERPGRIRYETVNDSARAPGDYTAVAGEAVFTEAGYHEIRIPVFDDDLSEGEETFEVRAWEEPPADPWLWKSTATVRIVDNDDDPAPEPAAPGVTSTTTVTGSRSPRPAASGAPVNSAGALVTDDAATPPTTASGSSDPDAGLAAGEVPPAATGLAVPEDVGADPASSGEEPGGATSPWILPVAAALMSLSAASWLQRRGRSSPRE